MSLWNVNESPVDKPTGDVDAILTIKSVLKDTSSPFLIANVNGVLRVNAVPAIPAPAFKPAIVPKDVETPLVMWNTSDPRTSAPSGITPNIVTKPTGDKPLLILNQFQHL